MRRSRDESVLSELRLLGGGLPIGASAHGEMCPYCRGGSSGERSLSVTRLDPLKIGYCCHRASCGAHGFIGGTPSSGSQPARKAGTERLYTHPTRPLGEEWKSELRDRYALDGDRFGWLEEVGSGRLVVRVCGPDGKERGIHTRTRKGTRESSYTQDYRLPDMAWMAWTETSSALDQREIILVEDVFSAAKVCCAGFLSCSLMGSNLSLDQFLEANGVATRTRGRIVIALDKDATDKAIKYVRQYSFLSGGTLTPLLLSKDLKYHTTEEIQEMVRSIGNTHP